MTPQRNPIARTVRLAAAALMLVVLAACAQSFRADVSRFQSQLPAPTGQSFAVVADDPKLAGGLEFAQYAALVEARMADLGYAKAAPDKASLLVRFDYGVDTGRDKVRSTAFSNDPFYSSWYGYRGPFREPRFAFGSSRAWGYGWQDPFFDGGVESYTVYTSGVEMKIDRAADGQRLFEGKAQALSRSNRLQYLVPNLVEAMFSGFPGNSGETVRISVAPEKK